MPIDNVPDPDRSFNQPARDIPYIFKDQNRSEWFAKRITQLVKDVLEMLPKSWWIGDTISLIINGKN
jgi:hypothetical protein